MDNDTYYLSYHSAEQALLREQAYYQAQAGDYNLGPSERAQAIAVGVQIDSKLALLRAELDTFVAKYDSAGMPAPSQDMLQRADDLAKTLAQELKNEAMASAVLAIISKFMDSWTKLLS
jgi:hypothetical protein